MHRLPLSDRLPYRFHPPRPHPLGMRLTRPLRRRMLRREHEIVGLDIQGLDRLSAPLGRGGGLMLAANHPGRADGLVLLELADRLGRPFCTMAAHQLFAGSAGLRRWLFPRLGIFPVDREGADRSAYKTAVETLTEGKYPLLIFPEGEVYHLADRLTPLREGAAAIAVAAAKKRADAGRPVSVVPIALKYRFPDGFDPRPAFDRLLASLERRLTWRPRTDRPLVARIYDLAGALLGLKELEYLGEAGCGPLPQRIIRLREHILDRLERRLLGRSRGGEPVPPRVKDLRHACLEALAAPGTSVADACQLRRDLDDAFLVVQAFSYPGDYVAERPTLERVAETLAKLDEDLLRDNDYARPLGPRRAVLRVGEPIEVAPILAAAPRPRDAIATLTTELERRLQALLDAIGPGRPLVPTPAGADPAAPGSR